MKTTVYTKPLCPQCDATKRKLDKLNINYKTIDITRDTAALQSIKDLGYQQVPVIITNTGEHWAGYRPDKIQTLTNNQQIP